MSEDKKKEETKAESTETVETKPKSNLMKYIIFAVGGLVLIGGIAFGVAFMLKESPKADIEETNEVSDNSHEEKKSDQHVSEKTEKSDNHAEKNSHADDSHAVENKRDNNLEISKEDFQDAGDDEFDTKAIEKIVDNLAFLEYTPDDSEIENIDGMSVEDSLEQVSWIEKETLTLDTRKKELDRREKDLNKLEKSVDSKIIRIEQAESNRTSQLAKLYDGMDSRAVAKLMMSLDDNTIVTILPRMKSKNAALVLQLLPSKRAASLSKQMITIADR